MRPIVSAEWELSCNFIKLAEGLPASFMKLHESSKFLSWHKRSIQVTYSNVQGSLRVMLPHSSWVWEMPLMYQHYLLGSKFKGTIFNLSPGLDLGCLLNGTKQAVFSSWATLPPKPSWLPEFKSYYSILLPGDAILPFCLFVSQCD